jgi:uncharacterized OB-fold protein
MNGLKGDRPLPRCRACGHVVSLSANSCQRCGSKLATPTMALAKIGTVAIFVILFVVLLSRCQA